MTIPTDGRIDLDALAELQAWLLKRAQPNSGLRYERYGDGLARVEFYGGDATFVADHFHSKGAKTLADAIDLVRRAAIPSEQGEAVAWVFELARARQQQTGEWMHFGPPQLSFTKPNVPDGSIRNLHALGYAHPAPAVGVKVTDDALTWFNACWKLSGTGMSKVQFLAKYRSHLGVSDEVAERMRAALDQGELK